MGVDENDRREAHTHKNTVLTEAENTPNFHTRKKRIVVNAKSKEVEVEDGWIIS